LRQKRTQILANLHAVADRYAPGFGSDPQPPTHPLTPHVPFVVKVSMNPVIVTLVPFSSEKPGSGAT